MFSYVFTLKSPSFCLSLCWRNRNQIGFFLWTKWSNFPWHSILLIKNMKSFSFYLWRLPFRFSSVVQSLSILINPAFNNSTLIIKHLPLQMSHKLCLSLSLSSSQSVIGKCTLAVHRISTNFPWRMTSFQRGINRIWWW